MEPAPTIDHRLSCSPAEVWQQGCDHGGRCFAIETSNGRTLACKCATGWTSARCQMRFLDPSIYAVHQENIRTANIAAGVSVCIIVALVLLVAIWVYDRLRQKRRRPEENHNDRHLMDGTNADAKDSPNVGRLSELNANTISECRQETPLYAAGADAVVIPLTSVCEDDVVLAPSPSPSPSPSPLAPLRAPRAARFTIVSMPTDT